MKVGDVVQLKSGGPNMTIDWEIGITPTPSDYPLGDIGTFLKNKYGLDNGDNRCMWIYKTKIEQRAFPVETLILLPPNLIHATNQTLTMGSVVKINSEDQLMTVNWVIGTNCRPVQLMDTDLILLQRYQKGDVSCLWFDKKGKLNEQIFSASILTKIFD